MSKAVYFAMYPTDFLADVGHLGNTELGIYWRLLLVYYRDQRPLPFETDKLRRLAMTFSPEEHRALDAVVSEFFVLSTEPDGTRCWRNKRADIEIARASNAHQKKSEAAKRTNLTRWGKGSLSDSHTESLSDSASDREATENQNQIKKERKEREGAPRFVLPEGIPEDVWSDWDAYRRARKGWTDRARALALSTLQALRGEGYDLRKCVDNAIERGWSKVYPVKDALKAGSDELMRGAL